MGSLHLKNKGEYNDELTMALALLCNPVREKEKQCKNIYDSSVLDEYMGPHSVVSNLFY